MYSHCSDVRVARISQDPQEIVENVVAAAEGISKILPKKWANIQALYLKTSVSCWLSENLHGLIIDDSQVVA